MIDTLLEFWFGPLAGPASINQDRFDLWFVNGRAYDDVIRAQFGAIYEQACQGKLEHWADAPSGRLALIVLLDQFSRHIHRETPAAFAQDGKAQALSLAGINLGYDQALVPIQRVFFYMPLEHAEDLAFQERSVAVFAALALKVAPELRAEFEEFLDYARRHRDIIARFGRFPDLNRILGRDSTAEEIAFLSEPGSSFL